MTTHCLKPARWPDPIVAGSDVTEFMAPTLGIEPPKNDDPIYSVMLDALVAEDTVAVELVNWMRNIPSGKEDFHTALERGLSAVAQPSDPLSAFFNAVEDRPSWADEEIIAEAGKIHFRLGRVGQLSSGTLGLLAGYRNSAVAKTLCATNSLASATPRRLAETAKFVFDVCDSTGMGRFSNGFKSAVQVRRIHAVVRGGLARSPNWKAELWGPPVSIMDTLSTSMGFWVPSVLSQKKLGHTLTRDEQFAMMTMWNYVGYLQGVPEELLPQDLDECYKIYCCLRVVFPPADDDSRLLADSLLTAMGRENGKHTSLASKLYHGTVAGLLPKEYLDDLSIPNTAYRHWLKLLKPIVQRREARCRKDADHLQTTQLQGRKDMQRAFKNIEAHFDPDTVIENQAAVSAAA